MVGVALTVEQQVVPSAEKSKTITCEIDVLAAAIRLSYLAGQTEAAQAQETLRFLQRTIRSMQRSMRRARAAPREGVEAGLDLMLRAVEERLGISAEDAFRVAA